MDDLLCNEEHLLVSPAMELVVPRDTNIDPVEVIRLMAKREGEYGARNPAYLKEVQRHGMEAVWRRKICRWMFETAKAFELTKDTVGCAVHIMDHYLSRASVDKIMLQLVAMISLYIASKMHEHQPISMEEMDLLSQRKFTRADICKVESEILQLLGWKLNPPTSFTFARDFIQLLPTSADIKAVLEEEVECFLQDATEDYSSVRFKSASVGIAAVQVVWNARKMRPSAIIQDAIHSLNVTSDDFLECYLVLREMHHAKYQQPRFVSVEESKTMESTRSISPTSVEDATFLYDGVETQLDDRIVQEMLCHGKIRAAASPEGQSASKRARRDC